MRDIAVFSGSAHPELAQEICAHLGAPLSPTRVQRFANDCLEVQLQANCRDRDVYLVQPLVPPVQEHLVELLLMLDAARGASAVGESQRGLASGLLNSSAQVGTALGLAVLFAIAAAVSAAVAGGGEPSPEALVAGYRVAFSVGAGIAAAGALAAMLLIREKRG